MNSNKYQQRYNLNFFASIFVNPFIKKQYILYKQNGIEKIKAQIKLSFKNEKINSIKFVQIKFS